MRAIAGIVVAQCFEDAAISPVESSTAVAPESFALDSITLGRLVQDMTVTGARIITASFFFLAARCLVSNRAFCVTVAVLLIQIRAQCMRTLVTSLCGALYPGNAACALIVLWIALFLLTKRIFSSIFDDVTGITSLGTITTPALGKAALRLIFPLVRQAP
jgi:hypothetical protein